MLIVTTWWIRLWLPMGPLWVVAIGVSLILSGWLAGLLARRMAGDGGERAVYAAAAMTVLVTVTNIVLDVAVEPLWFKVLVLTLLVPSLLVSGRRRGSVHTPKSTAS